MAWKEPIRRGAKVGLKLTQSERALLLEGIVSVHEGAQRALRDTSPSQPVPITPTTLTTSLATSRAGRITPRTGRKRSGWTRKRVFHRDLPNAEPKNERQTLDVYAPAEGKDHPIVLWIHGGGWRRGDKRGVQKKPEAFVEEGFVFVSTNYRFVPNDTVKEMTGDFAKALRWVHDHAEEYGGDPDTIFVMGHSAGAHLAALVCTDDRYLKAEGLSPGIIKGCVPVDTAGYDVVKQVESIGPARSAMYGDVFGDAQSQKGLPPIAHVAKGKGIPPFLILHVADRPDPKAQSGMLARALQDAGVSARVVPAEGKTHGTINSDLGLPDDEPTKALFEFLEGALNRKKTLP